MRQIIVVVVILLPFSFSVAVGEETIVLKADRLVDVQKGKLVKNATVVIVGNRIESVNPRRLPKESRVIDLGDSYARPHGYAPSPHFHHKQEPLHGEVHS